MLLQTHASLFDKKIFSTMFKHAIFTQSNMKRVLDKYHSKCGRRTGQRTWQITNMKNFKDTRDISRPKTDLKGQMESVGNSAKHVRRTCLRQVLFFSK